MILVGKLHPIKTTARLRFKFQVQLQVLAQVLKQSVVTVAVVAVCWSYDICTVLSCINPLSLSLSLSFRAGLGLLLLRLPVLSLLIITTLEII